MRYRILSALLAAALVGVIIGQLAAHPYSLYAYGSTYVADASTELTDIGTTWTTVTSFTTASGSAVTWDAGGDIATIVKAGTFYVSIQLSFSGSATDTFNCSVFTADTTEQKAVHFTRKLGATGDIGSAGASGVLTLPAGETVRIKCKGSASGDDMTPQDAQFTLVRIG